MLSGLITAQHTIQSLFKSNFALVLEPFVDQSTVLVNPTVAWFNKIGGSCVLNILAQRRLNRPGFNNIASAFTTMFGA